MIAPVDYGCATREAPSSKEDDELHKLGERIAELAARINSAEARMMRLIADFDRRGGWKDGGFSSCAEWLAWRIVNGDETVLFLMPKGRMLVDAPTRPKAARGRARREMIARNTRPGGGLASESASGLLLVPSVHGPAPDETAASPLPPVPSVYRGAPGKGDGITLSNGAALYRDSEIPWEIEAAAREAMVESP